MLSKWKIWDFQRSNPKGIEKNKSGVYAFQAFDPIILSFVKDLFPRDIFSEGKLPTLLGKEITTNWFDDNFKSLGLFGNSESFHILSAQDMKADIKEMILEDSLILEDRYLILFFDKADDFYNKLVKKDSVTGIQIQAPAFWETDMLLDYMASQLGVLLSYQAKNLILQFTNHTCLDFYNLLTILQVNYKDQEVSPQMLDELIDKSRLDQFEMATFFGFKQSKEFYKKLLDIDPDFNTLRGLFYFIQSHMIKVSDPSYIRKKKKESKYDKQVMSQSKMWKTGDIEKALDYLKYLELEAKKKNPLLKDMLRNAYYRCLSY